LLVGWVEIQVARVDVRLVGDDGVERIAGAGDGEASLRAAISPNVNGR
jgi:hypothetical protein